MKVLPRRTPLSGSVIWPVVHEERRALVADLAALHPAQWQTPSLCPGWSIQDVLAHLIDTAKTTRLSFVRDMMAARFDFDHANALGIAREHTEDPGAALAEFRTVQTRRTGPPVPLATRLVEAFIHGEDIRRPMKIHRTYTPAHVVTALRYQLKTTVKIGGGKERGEGWRLVATDEAFIHGTGPEVRGPAIVLLLAVSGRPVLPHELVGPGAAAFIRNHKGRRKTAVEGHNRSAEIVPVPRAYPSRLLPPSVRASPLYRPLSAGQEYVPAPAYSARNAMSFQAYLDNVEQKTGLTPPVIHRHCQNEGVRRCG